MIEEAFLICALSVSPVSFTRDNPFPFTRSIGHFLKISGAMLVVEGDSKVLEHLRTRGEKAFGALPLRASYPFAQWSTYSDFREFPFSPERFSAVFWLYPTLDNYTYAHRWLDFLEEAVRITAPGGYLFYNENFYHRWAKLLSSFGWTRLPFKLGEYSIFQKPATPQARRQIQEAA